MYDLRKVYKRYDDNIKPGSQLEKELKNAKEAARSAIRSRLADLIKAKTGIAVRQPRFFVQGSFSYNTAISPERPPTQQADLDDGIYLPTSFFDKAPRGILATAFVEATEEILSDLAKANGWSYRDDNPSCARICLPSGESHIDFTRYAMPEEDFDQSIMEAKESAALNNAERERLNGGFYDDLFELMPRNEVVLAHKEKGWIKSDPRPIKEMVENWNRLYDYQFKTIVRIFKGWRDHQTWSNSDPKSLLLMVALEKALSTCDESRLDLMILHCAQMLPSILAGSVILPVDESNDLAARLDADGIRRETIEKLTSLFRQLAYIHSGRALPPEALKILRQEFGSRLANDVKDLIIAKVNSAPAVITQRAEPIGSNLSG